MSADAEFTIGSGAGALRLPRIIVGVSKKEELGDGLAFDVAEGECA